jgi:osmotically-inducible protein OsmY
MHDDVKYAVQSQVVTLTGNVDSQDLRAQAAQVAGAVPNVLEVVNELQVKDQKATATR